MPVSFNNIPSNVRVPLFYAEMDNSMAGSYQQGYKTLLIGQSLKDIPNIPKLITSVKAVEELTGKGSMLSEMYKSFRFNEPLMEVWILPLADATAGIASDGKVSISGSVTDNGVLHLYIAGQDIQVMTPKGYSGADVAGDVADRINSMSSLPIIASVDAEEVTLACKWKGVAGNSIDVRINYLGDTGGEVTPTGLTVGITPMDGGQVNPDILEGLTALGDEEFDFIVLPYTDVNNLNAIRDFMDDVTGRWSYSKQIYGHVYCAVSMGVAEAQSLGASRNDQHCSILPYNGSPTPPWCVATILAAQSAKALSIDPARPLQTLPLKGMLPPDIQDRFIMLERNTLLFNGMSTFVVQAGVCQIERVITTYQTNSYGQPDNSYLDVETLYTSAYVIRAMRQRITQKYGRHKLADDGARFGAGQAIVTPRIIKAELIALYGELEYQGLVENSTVFKDHLVVERDAADVNRLNILFPPDYVNQLRIFAVLNQFRLNY